MDKLDFHLEYEWQPFTVAGRHLIFFEHQETRLLRDKCSHWGAAIYKWEGTLTQGEHAGKLGILIGETDNLRQRVKQYIKGTQPRGNAYWRKEFLLRGRYSTLRLETLRSDFRSQAQCNGFRCTRFLQRQSAACLRTTLGDE